MTRSSQQLRTDALAIWNAAVDAVRSDRLVRNNVRVVGDRLLVGDETSGTLTEIALKSVRRIAVVGAGKAGAGMAAGLEDALGPQLLDEKQVHGWVNVPSDCVRSLKAIHLHGARPPGINEPTGEGVMGTNRILEIVSTLGPDDVCICLISGGGSALLPAPVAGVTLADKQAITRLLSAAGANIQELNTVRKQLSRIKGGGLARACRAGRLITLIISDVLGDPLDVIASGPTTVNSTIAADALQILERYAASSSAAPQAIFDYLRQALSNDRPAPPPQTVTNLVIGNNAVAVDAAGVEAERRGYSHAMLAATSLEGAAESIGIHHAQMALEMCRQPGPDCLITGGEPTVTLAPADIRGKGGRNQQLVLAALAEVLASPPSNVADINPTFKIQNPKSNLLLLSGGTDGEDGPTDAAGAFFDSEIIDRTAELALDPADFLHRNDAYTFFSRVGGLLKTGPTDTNVCDIRIVLVDRT